MTAGHGAAENAEAPEGARAAEDAEDVYKRQDYDVVFKSPGIVLERPENEYRCSILSVSYTHLNMVWRHCAAAVIVIYLNP